MDHALPSIPLARGRAEAPCTTQPCSRCCHDTEMTLTEADIERLATLMGDDSAWFEADDGFVQLRTRDAPPARGSPAGQACVLLGDDGHCRVWNDRPEGCRLYPAIWDDAHRVVLDAEHCPHTDGFMLPGTTQAAVRRLAQRLHRERDARVARRASGRAGDAA